VRTEAMTPIPAPTWADSGTRPPGAILKEHNRQVKVNTGLILDGTSNTLMVGEKRIHRMYMDVAQAGYNSDNEDCYTAGFGDDNTGYYAKAPELDLMLGSQAGSLTANQFGSSHPGAFNALLSDGSVRSIRYSVSTTIFTRFGNRKDGQAMGAGDL
jgi:hypothetical protein